MRTFPLTLLDGRGVQRFDTLVAFMAADASGSFGVLAGHAAMVAVLRFGLARFVDDARTTRYLALPGGVLRFADNRLTLVTVRYFLGEDRSTIVEQLATAMARRDSDIRAARATLNEIEHSLLRGLIRLTHGEPVSAA
jgi:F-type H+-transporting ATPase subunit epsilon